MKVADLDSHAYRALEASLFLQATSILPILQLLACSPVEHSDPHPPLRDVLLRPMKLLEVDCLLQL
jgi:hypothetical protein